MRGLSVVGVCACVVLPVTGCAGNRAGATEAVVPDSGDRSVMVGEPAPGVSESIGSGLVASPAGARAAAAAGEVACPGTATLQAVAELDVGFRIDAASINCWKTWAVVGVRTPATAQQGDGLLLFRSVAGRWSKAGEGSSFDCVSDLALKPGSEHPAWCTFA